MRHSIRTRELRWSFDGTGMRGACYAYDRLAGPRWEASYVGCIRYDEGNWLVRFLWPKRWVAIVGLKSQCFRFMVEAQAFVEGRARG
jgi:hypothetical protein